MLLNHLCFHDTTGSTKLISSLPFRQAAIRLCLPWTGLCNNQGCCLTGAQQPGAPKKVFWAPKFLPQLQKHYLLGSLLFGFCPSGFLEILLGKSFDNLFLILFVDKLPELLPNICPGQMEAFFPSPALLWVSESEWNSNSSTGWTPGITFSRSIILTNTDAWHRGRVAPVSG